MIEGTELYAFGECSATNLPTGAVLLVSKYSSSQLVVNQDVFVALKQCTTLRSLQEHAIHLTVCMPKLKGNVEGAHRLLEAVRGAGLLTAASEFIEKLKEVRRSQASPAPSRVFIITCDRPSAVERLLNSMLVVTELSLHEGFYLVDDSRDEENATQNQKLVDNFNQQSQVTMHYFGQLERDNLIIQLITHSPDYEESIRFLLDQQRWRGYKTYSLPRTICLLLSVGFRSVVLDDDTLCTAIDPPFKSAGVDFKDSMREAAFYPSVEAWHSGSTPREEDPLAGHLRCLGLNVPDALSQLGIASMGAEALKNSQTQVLRRLSASSSVLVTQCGTYGDPGTGNTAWCFSLEGESLDRLLLTPPSIEEKVTTRQYWLGRSKPTFSTAAIMSQVTGLDNTAVLPPYFPAGRGEDLLFGAMTQYLHPSSMVLSYDWAIPHLPLEERKGNIDWSMEQNGIRILSNYIKHHAELNQGVSLENRWRSLVLLLQALSELPDQGLSTIYRSQLSIDLSNTARTLTDKLRNIPVEHTEWRLMLESRQKQCFDAISRKEMPVQLGGVPDGMSEHDMWEHLRGFFSAFALALEAWPTIRQAAASLNANSEISFGEKEASPPGLFCASGQAGTPLPYQHFLSEKERLLKQEEITLPAGKMGNMQPNEKLPRPVVILGAWGSGTSVLTGIFEKLGFSSCPPHFMTNDQRTPNSYESISLRHITRQYFDESTLSRISSPSDIIVRDLKQWYEQEVISCMQLSKCGVVMKIPHLCFFVPELYQAFNPQFIFITRALDKIEKTRQRRNWFEFLGKVGAEQCIEAAITDLVALERSFLTVSFNELLLNPEQEVRNVLSFLGRNFSDDEIQGACTLIVRDR